jgi:hypothetical protein
LRGKARYCNDFSLLKNLKEGLFLSKDALGKLKGKLSEADFKSAGLSGRTLEKLREIWRSGQ